MNRFLIILVILASLPTNISSAGRLRKILSKPYKVLKKQRVRKKQKVRRIRIRRCRN